VVWGGGVVRDDVVEVNGVVAVGYVGHRVDGQEHGAGTHIEEQECSRMMGVLRMVVGLDCSHTLGQDGGAREGHMGLGLGHSEGWDLDHSGVEGWDYTGLGRAVFQWEDDRGLSFSPGAEALGLV